MDYQNFLLTVLLTLACGLVALLLKNGKAELLRYVAHLVQEAETVIRGSGLGPEKKKWVIDQLEAAGVHGTAWLSRQIDLAVKSLNTHGAWLAGRTHRQLTGEEQDHE